MNYNDTSMQPVIFFPHPQTIFFIYLLKQIHIMKLRQSPSDFKVEEINDFKISSKKDNFKLYLLEKQNFETFQLLNYIARSNKIPQKQIGIEGLKDRHAVTKQYLTVPCKYEIK